MVGYLSKHFSFVILARLNRSDENLGNQATVPTSPGGVGTVVWFPKFSSQNISTKDSLLESTIQFAGINAIPYHVLFVVYTMSLDNYVPRGV